MIAFQQVRKQTWAFSPWLYPSRRGQVAAPQDDIFLTLMVRGNAARLEPCRSVRRQRRARGADQPVRLLQHVVVFRLLAGKEAEHHEQRAERQAGQHDSAVGAFVGVVK
jgi:hypothetical protein